MPDNVMSKETISQTIQALKPSFMGKFFYYIIPIRRSIAEKNMCQAFSGISEEDVKKLCQCFYTHLFKSFIENVIFSFMSETQIKARVEVRGMHHLYDAAKEEKGILILTGHFGNWEFSPMAGIAHFPEFKGRLHILRRQIVNKTIEKILFRRFYAMGLDIIPKRNSLNRVMDALGKNDTVAFIMDQYARPGKEGIMVDFFGKTAGTFKSLAMVKRSAESPVISQTCWREPNGKHVIEFSAPIPWKTTQDPNEEILINTKTYNEVLESFVTAHPDQWLWIHKRWKTKPNPRKK